MTYSYIKYSCSEIEKNGSVLYLSDCYINCEDAGNRSSGYRVCRSCVCCGSVKPGTVSAVDKSFQLTALVV